MFSKLALLLHKPVAGAGFGTVAVEFAIIFPLVAVLIAGAIDFGLWENQQTQLEAATRAGAQCAFINPTNAANSCDIKNTVVSYASFSPAITTSNVTVTTFCTCSDNTSVTCPGVGVADPCPAVKSQTDTRVFQYLAVQATQTFSPMFTPFGPSSLSAGTVTRFR